MILSPHGIRSFVCGALCLLGTAAMGSAEAGPSKLDSALRQAKREGAVLRVIIRTEPGKTQALEAALAAHGDVVITEFPALNAVAVRLHGEHLAALEANRSVLSVSSDAEVRAFAAPADLRERVAPVDLLRTTLGLAGVSYTGAGVNVAIVDSGIDPNRDLAAAIVRFWDFTRGGIETRPYDDYGHGTHVAGLIASNGVESNGEFAGIASGARLYGFKVLDSTGRGRVSDVISALEMIVARRRSGIAPRIDVVNLSLGHPIFEPASTDPLVRAVESAARAGIVVVTAAGNFGTDAAGTTGYSGITSPGNAPSAITVGAVDTKNTVTLADDQVAAFSSRGPTWFDGFAKPDFVAPGVGLISDAPRFSSLLLQYPALREVAASGKGSFARLSGTSMSAAVTSGVAALVLEASRSANPGGRPLTSNAVKAVLQYTSVSLSAAAGAPYDALTQGTGEINGRGAIAMASAIDTAAPVGAAWLRFSPAPVTPTAYGNLIWSQALLWDDNIVWGTAALSFNSPQWNDDIVWGTALGSDDNIVWGTAAEIDNIVWGTAVSWSTDLVWADRIIGLMQEDDNIVWGTVAGLTEDNIVWGTWDGDNIVWGTWDGDNIVWGTSDEDDIVWGTSDEDNIVWGTSDDENVVWGTALAVLR